MRRSPREILTAHLMDRERRELYVEGSHDRIFLSWLVGEKRNPNALVAEIGSVELPLMYRRRREGTIDRFRKGGRRGWSTN